MRIAIIGAGVAGLTCAVELAERGVAVEVFERASVIGQTSCSWYAGGMLAPWCELERAEPLISTLGEQSVAWWSRQFSEVVHKGTLVVAHGRDAVELTRFAQRTHRHRRVAAALIEMLEPDLGGASTRAFISRMRRILTHAPLSSCSRGGSSNSAALCTWAHLPHRRNLRIARSSIALGSIGTVFSSRRRWRSESQILCCTVATSRR